MTNYFKSINKIIKKVDFINFHDFKDCSVMITGANGLLGKYLVDFFMTLNKVYNLNIFVTATSLNIKMLCKNFEIYDDDILFDSYQYDVLDKLKTTKKYDYIIHAASPASPNQYISKPVNVIMANILGLFNIIEYSKHFNSKIIYISSGEVYGNQLCSPGGYVESDIGLIDNKNVRSCYSESKRCAETLAFSSVVQYNLDVVCARLCFTYGPTFSENDDRVIFQFVNSVKDKKNIILKSDGSQKRSYCYVGDAVTAILTLILKGRTGEVYNISNNDSNISIKELADMIAYKKNVKVVYEKGSYHKGWSPYENAIQNPYKLMNLGWQPIIDLDEGLDLTINLKR